MSTVPDNVVPLRGATIRRLPEPTPALIHAAAVLLVKGSVRVQAVDRHPSGALLVCAVRVTGADDAPYAVTFDPQRGYECDCGPAKAGRACAHRLAVGQIVPPL